MATDVTYYVLNGHTLGYIDARRPDIFNILHASVLRGSTFDRLAGFTYVQPNVDRLQPATHADFEQFRVSPVGHLEQSA